MASMDVAVLSVRIAKQRKPRPRRKADERNEARKDQDLKGNLKVKDELKEEAEERKVLATGTTPEAKDVKKEVKEEVSKYVQRKAETGIKDDKSQEMEEEVKEEMTQKGIKQEVKEELSKDIHMQVKEEIKEAKAEIKSEMKQEDHQMQRKVTGVKRELVHEEEQVYIKEEHAEQAGPIQDVKRRRISQKRSEASVPSFESRLTEWAEKCLAFQSSGKMWLPTKPCCPASPFLGLAGAPWQGCARDKTIACVQLLGKEQFRELRDFYLENPHHALFHDSSDASSGRQTETTAASRLQAHRSSTGNQHRAAECMKMWPWMRDLPTRAWAGNGWLLVEDGMMKLSPTGGGSAMQGLEIFESMGSVPEPGETSSRAEPRAEQGQVVTRSFRGLERQSGIQGISWHVPKQCWQMSFIEAGKRKRPTFPISQHMKLGLSEAEAVEAALQEAKAFRKELVRQGKLKPPKPITEKASGSAVRGIVYYKSTGEYRVKLTDPSTKKLVHGGMFKVKEEAEARARELARELGVESEGGVVPVKRLSELPHFEPLGPQPGITWVPGEQAWHARHTNAFGKQDHMRFRPKDFSPKEVEKAWKQAVSWRKQKEKERAEQPRKR